MEDIIVELDGTRYKTNRFYPANGAACESSLHSLIYSRICSRELIPIQEIPNDAAVNITVENGGTLRIKKNT